jgi:hypothetical protein
VHDLERVSQRAEAVIVIAAEQFEIARVEPLPTPRRSLPPDKA